MLVLVITACWTAAVTLCVALCRAAAWGDEIPTGLPLAPGDPLPKAPEQTGRATPTGVGPMNVLTSLGGRTAAGPAQGCAEA